MSDTTRGVAKLSQAVGKALGLPQDLQFYSAFPFAGMNQQDARTAIEDSESYWCENLIWTGRASLRSLWDRGNTLFSDPGGRQIVYFKWYNIGEDDFCAVFFNDGTALQVAFPSGAQTGISAVLGTFYNGGQLPVAQQSGNLFLLIANNLTPNDYWIWDGQVLYGAGTLGPFQVGDLTSSGLGYTSAPAVRFFGGSGTGATGTATVVNGAVTSVQVTNPGTGYVPGDQVQIAFSGGGSDSSALLQAVLTAGTVDHLELISGGTGYTSAPAIVFSSGTAAATATVTGGVITSINITNHGGGYTSTPTVSFSGGGGTGASAVAVLSPGSVASVTVVDTGTGFSGTPLLTFTGGGGGTGAAATANLTFGGITSVTVTAGGSGYTSPPTIVVGTALNNAAAGAIDVMPFGVSGTTLETFLSRVWIAVPAQIAPQSTGGTFQVSAPASLTDFATSDGGLLFPNSDRFLRKHYTSLRQNNGFLYPFGDSSVYVISNVQTSGSPPTTTFLFQNASAQAGAAWRDTVEDFGKALLFANQTGVFGLFGGGASKLSDKINNIFDRAVFPPTSGALTPSGAAASVHTIPVYLLLLTITDPFTHTPRNVLVGFDEKRWFVASQSASLKFIGTQMINSEMTAWGTDGVSLFPLFGLPSANLSKLLVTKYFGGERELLIKEPLAVYYRATDKSSNAAGVNLTATMEGTGWQTQVGQPGQPPAETFVNPIQPNFVAPDGTMPSWGGQTAAVPGSAIGLTLQSNSPDFVLSGVSIAYREIQALFG
jgi:hypothetical protein